MCESIHLVENAIVFFSLKFQRCRNVFDTDENVDMYTNCHGLSEWRILINSIHLCWRLERFYALEISEYLNI